MEDIKDEKIQNRPKMEIKLHQKLGAYEINYSGSLMIITKEDLKKINDQFIAYEKKIAKLTSDFDIAKDQIKSLKSELAETKSDKEKVEDKLNAFLNYQRNGRPPVLSDEHKNIIKTLYGKKMSVADIHKALILQFGFKGNYETVRKYIRDSEKVRKWQ